MMGTTASKLVSMQRAIAEQVPSGSMVVMGAQLEQMIPFAAGHEIIRQGRRDLTLVGPISDILFDQMIGAGCVTRVMAAWVGNASAGMGYCFRRAVEKSIPRAIETVDHTNLTLALALHAAAMGVPFLPTYSTLGSDLLKRNGNLREFSSPVNEERLVAVRALQGIHGRLGDGHGLAGRKGFEELLRVGLSTVDDQEQEVVDVGRFASVTHQGFTAACRLRRGLEAVHHSLV